jgi:hypothetical protein
MLALDIYIIRFSNVSKAQSEYQRTGFTFTEDTEDTEDT